MTDLSRGIEQCNTLNEKVLQQLPIKQFKHKTIYNWTELDGLPLIIMPASACCDL